jgi:hypothetical protein
LYLENEDYEVVGNYASKQTERDLLEKREDRKRGQDDFDDEQDNGGEMFSFQHDKDDQLDSDEMPTTSKKPNRGGGMEAGPQGGRGMQNKNLQRHLTDEDAGDTDEGEGEISSEGSVGPNGEEPDQDHVRRAETMGSVAVGLRDPNRKVASINSLAFKNGVADASKTGSVKKRSDGESAANMSMQSNLKLGGTNKPR